MQVETYCKAMKAEVSAWKEKLEAMKKTADSFGSEQKEKVLPLIGQLEQLENECPSDWSPVKNELDELFGTVGSKINHQFQEVSSREALW